MVYRYFSTSFFRRFSSRTSIINFLQYKLKGEVSIIDMPAMKIVVKSSLFNLLPKMDQHKTVLDLLPDEFKNNVIIETSPLPEEINREVRKVYLRKVNNLTGETIPATPQSLLDDAVYNLKQNNGVLASECLWLCGSLALKNFSLAYNIGLKNHMAKNYLVRFIASQFGKDIYTPWMILNACHAKYEDLMLLEMIDDSLEKAENFCNLLYKYHCEKKFDFKKAVPEWMYQETKTKNGDIIKKFDLYFQVM